MNTKVTVVTAFDNIVRTLMSKAKVATRIATLLLGLNLIANVAMAQCSLGCNDNVQISLDGNCEATITPDMISPGAATSCPGGSFSVMVLNLNNVVIATSPKVTRTDVGKRLIVKVIDNVSGNFCWGSILVEDKLAPTISNCGDITVACNVDINNSTQVPPPTTTDCSTATLTYTDVMNDIPCNDPSPFTAIITRTYTAKDVSGNTSTCVRRIYFKKIVFADITLPKHRDGVQEPVLNCSTANTNPSSTGEPTVDGRPLTNMCDFLATYTDQTREVCAGSKIILRTWIIMDWCSGTANNYVQHIRVEDKTAPMITCPQNMSVGAKSTSCVADVTIPAITVSDNCSPTNKITLNYTATQGTIVGNKINELPLGNTLVTVTATDDCGNSSSCTFRILVIDSAPPVAVCTGFKKISLGLDGAAELGAASFDDGSVDNCGIDRFEISRMGATVSFGPKIKFDCNDVNDTVSVILRVWDNNGNYNDCISVAYIEDKLAPSITCPPNITLACRSDYKNTTITGNAVAADNCTVAVKYVDVVNVNNCGVGSVRRTWSATDAGGRQVQCIQMIYLINETPFYINPTNNNDPNDDVTWPADFVGSTCGDKLLPAVTGAPQTKADDCDQIAVTYEDTEIPAIGGGCKHVLRKWIIVDFCTFKPNETPRKGYWEYTQSIKVVNNDPPVLSSDCKDITIDLDEKDCTSKKLDMKLTATDDCSDPTKLSWTVKIDLGNNGNYDILNATGDISANYPLGESLVYVSVSDGCGNLRTCTFKVIVKDAKKPTAVCIHGLSISLMASGMVDITAPMFNGGSFDNCSPATDLTYDIAPKTFTCQNVGPNLITFTVTDKAGNRDFCTSYIDVQDNMKMCPSTGTGNKASVAGAIMTNEDKGVEKVGLMIDGAMSPIMTSASGNFMLYKTIGQNISVKPEKDDDLLNGVSTFDIIKLSRHILGMEVFTNPYMLIAADVNHNNKITTSDIVSMRRAILGMTNNFDANQKSWRFVSKSHVFANPTEPFATAFPESYQVNLTNDTVSNFVAIKIGDFNASAKPNGIVASNPRGVAEKLVFSLDDVQMEAGKTYRIPLIINDKDVNGVQFTLRHDTRVSLKNIIPGNLPDMSAANLAVIENGTITASWNTNKTMDNNSTMATLELTANENVLLSEVLRLNSEVTAAEAYSTDEESKNVVLQFMKGTKNTLAQNSIVLYQNQPNPFSEVTQIGFYLPEAASAIISVMDITGKVVYRKSDEFSSGNHSININKRDVTNLTSGIFYYQIQTNGQTLSKKMIIVE